MSIYEDCGVYAVLELLVVIVLFTCATMVIGYRAIACYRGGDAQARDSEEILPPYSICESESQPGAPQQIAAYVPVTQPSHCMECEVKQRRIRSLEWEQEQLNALNEDFTAQIGTQNLDLEDKQAENEILKHELEDSYSRIEDFNCQLEDRDDLIDRVNQRIDNKDVHINHLNQKIAVREDFIRRQQCRLIMMNKFAEEKC